MYLEEDPLEELYRFRELDIKPGAKNFLRQIISEIGVEESRGGRLLEVRKDVAYVLRDVMTAVNQKASDSKMFDTPLDFEPTEVEKGLEQIRRRIFGGLH